MGSWFITIRALRKYAQDSRAAQQLLDQANKEMQQAAQALYDVSAGDWAEAFMAEQTKVQSWVSKILGIGSAYIDTCLKVADKYEEAESTGK